MGEIHTCSRSGDDIEGHSKVCREVIVNWQTQRRNNCTQFQRLAWMITTWPFQQAQRNLWRWSVQRKLSRWNWLQDPRVAPFDRPRAWSHPQGSNPKVDSSVRDASESRGVAHRPEAKSRVQSIQTSSRRKRCTAWEMECFEMCEITSSVQCHNRMTYWTKGVVNCSCGTRLRLSDKIWKVNKDRDDVLSIPNYVMKKGHLTVHVTGKHRGKEYITQRKKGGKKGKESHSGKSYGETTVELSRFEGGCRNCGKSGHKAADCWYKQQRKSQGEGTGSRKSKSKVTEFSESDSSKQTEETWTPNTSAPQSSLSQVNSIGCGDEGLWIFSLGDSKKRQHAVNWEISAIARLRSSSWWSILDVLDMSAHPGLHRNFQWWVLQKWRLWHRTSNNVALQHCGQQMVLRTRDDEQRWTNFDPDHSWRDERAPTPPEHFCTESSWRHNHLQSRLWSHHFSKRDIEFHISRLSFLFVHHSGEWNPASQSDGDGGRECGKWRGRREGSLRQR